MKRKIDEITEDSLFLENIQRVEIYDSIFFEESSKAWRENKVERENCTHEYKCTFINKSGKRCNRGLYNKSEKENAYIFCKIHIHKKYNPKVHLWD